MEEAQNTHFSESDGPEQSEGLAAHYPEGRRKTLNTRLRLSGFADKFFLPDG